MLEAIDLTKRYEKHLALDQLNSDHRARRGVLPPGCEWCGKSTTINLFLNFIQPSRGNRPGQRPGRG